MRSMWSACVSGLLAFGLLPMLSLEASANWFFGRYHGVAPTTYVETYPTSYVEVLPRSYLLPTSYFVPTTYLAPTSYVVPTTYVETVPASYFVPTSWVAPVVTRTYVQRPIYAYPTSYVVPSSYVYPTAFRDEAVDLCCATASSAPVATAATKAVPKPPAPATPPAVLDSEPVTPVGGGGGNSDAANTTTFPKKSAPEATVRRESAPAPEPGKKPAVTKDAPKTNTADASEITPPSVPVPDKEGTPANPNPGRVPPVAPGEDPIPPVVLPEGETTKRDSMKPVLSGVPKPYRRTTRKGDLNVLEGLVLSSDDGAPEEGVKVMLTNRAANGQTKQVVSDNLGRYAVRLPDGVWAVQVTTAGGKVYEISKLVVKEGQIIDDLGRDIPSLTITR